MISEAVRAVLVVQEPRERVVRASARIDAAYVEYQAALAAYGPYPRHGWKRVALAAKEARVLAAVEEFRAALAEALSEL